MVTAGFGSQVGVLALKVYNNQVSRSVSCGEGDTHITCLSSLIVTYNIQENPHIQSSL